VRGRETHRAFESGLSCEGGKIWRGPCGDHLGLGVGLQIFLLEKLGPE